MDDRDFHLVYYFYTLLIIIMPDITGIRFIKYLKTKP